MTVIVVQLPGSSSSSRHGLIQYLAQFTLAEEKNVATYWEGWCLLLVSILAFQRFLQGNKTAPYEKQSWLGLSVLAAGLSLDELGSIHERSPFLFSAWSLSGNMSSKIALAIPALLILIFTLRGMWRFACRRHFWMTLSAFILFGSVAFQEYLEFTVKWPWWAQGLRVGIEEGTELLGVFLLLSVVASATDVPRRVKSVTDLTPRVETLISLRLPVVLATLLGFIPLGIFSAFAIEDATYRGIPAAWLPFMLLNLAWMAAWTSAEMTEKYRKRFLLVALLALFFSLDQIIVFQRVIDKNLIQGTLGNWMLPCLATACLAISTLRTRPNIILMAVLLSLSLFLISGSELIPWLVTPLQALGIFWVLVSGLEVFRAADVRPTPMPCSVSSKRV
jgi:hypothetical protein